MNAAHPGIRAGIELAESCGNVPGRFLANLMTTDAADVLHLLQPVILRKLFGNVALAAELAGGWNFHHRVPVDRRIIMRRLRFARRRHRRVIEKLARLCAELGRIHQTVAAYPDGVGRIREIGHEIAALIVGDDDAREFGRQVSGFGDHPDPGFRACRPGDSSADVGGAHRHGWLRVNRGRDCTWQRHQASKHCQSRKRFGHEHRPPPAMEPARWPVFVAATLTKRSEGSNGFNEPLHRGRWRRKSGGPGRALFARVDRALARDDG